MIPEDNQDQGQSFREELLSLFRKEHSERWLDGRTRTGDSFRFLRRVCAQESEDVIMVFPSDRRPSRTNAARPKTEFRIKQWKKKGYGFLIN